MPTSVPQIVLSTNLDDDFIKKGTKAKKGGMGEGGIYRKKDDSRDYLVKITSSYDQTQKFRSHQEVLASRLALACGAAVPTIYEIQDSSDPQKVYVASEVIQHSTDFTADQIQQLQGPNKQNILSDCVIHAWLCNRDLVNTEGANFITDQDGRVYNVDLGNCLLSGFRGKIFKHVQEDQLNFFDDDNPVKLIPFLDTDNPDKFKLKTKSETSVEVRNKPQLQKLSANNEQEKKSCFLQGVLRIQAVSDEQLEAIVNSSGDTLSNKNIIIAGLKKRRQSLVAHAEKVYGPNALKEEQMALDIQKIMHQASIFPTCPLNGDAKVSWHSQYQNASKPIVTYDKTIPSSNVKLEYQDEDQANKAMEVYKQLGITKISLKAKIITTQISPSELHGIIQKNMVADRLQVLLGSYAINHTSDYKTPYTYGGKPFNKAALSAGMRPMINLDANSLAITFDTAKISVADFKQLLSETYGLSSTDYQATSDSNKIIIKDPKQFIYLVSTKLGARKTAVISENQDGQILAGQLDPKKKGGKQGFATAGGNSDLPMNPKAAAAGEGGDEFGYKITDPTLLTPIGSTVAGNVQNIFLASPGATDDQPQPIGYKEFKDDSIKWYSFAEFRDAYKKTSDGKDPIKFDRTSVEYYVKYYQRAIQKQLQELGLNNFIVICSKKPETLGMIYIKPSIPAGAITTNTITLQEQQKLEGLLQSSGVKFSSQDRTSLVTKKTAKTSEQYITRRIAKIDEALNPAIFLAKLKSANTPTPPIPSQPTQPTSAAPKKALLSDIAEKWATADPQPAVAADPKIIQKVDWDTFLKDHDQFTFTKIASENILHSDYIGSITHKGRTEDPLVNITTDKLYCPLDDKQQPKEDQPEAVAAALQELVKKHSVDHTDPLQIRPNKYFTEEHLSKILEVLKSKKILVMFQYSQEASTEIKKLINNYNTEQFASKTKKPDEPTTTTPVQPVTSPTKR